MKKLVLPIAMAFMMSPMLNAAETCFDQANVSTEDMEGTYQEKHEAFLKAYDECEAEKEEPALVE